MGGGGGKEGGRVTETGERSENTSNKYDRITHKVKIRERKQERKQNDSFAV